MISADSMCDDTRRRRRGSPKGRQSCPQRTTCPPDRGRHGVGADERPGGRRVSPSIGGRPIRPRSSCPSRRWSFRRSKPRLITRTSCSGDYYRFFNERMRRYRVQPFFNSVETPAERAAFVDALGVTHVLVDPPYYE